MHLCKQMIAWEWQKKTLNRRRYLIKNPLFDNFIMEIFILAITVSLPLILPLSICDHWNLKWLQWFRKSTKIVPFKWILIFQINGWQRTMDAKNAIELAAIVSKVAFRRLLKCQIFLFTLSVHFMQFYRHNSCLWCCMQSDLGVIYYTHSENNLYNNFIIRRIFGVHFLHVDGKVFGAKAPWCMEMLAARADDTDEYNNKSDKV